MPGPSFHPPDDARISTTAALVALGGHAVIILAALLLAGRPQDVVVASGVVAVTLVRGGPSGAASAPSVDRTGRPAASNSPAPATPAHDIVTVGERLDRLITPDITQSASTSTAPSAPPTPPILASQTTGGASNGAGSSQADRGLGRGEGAEGVDLYAAASLPSVGARPVAPPAGDLWDRVAPCWRAAAPRRATLVVEIGPDGGLTGSPQAVRKVAAPADPQTLLAERAAARALQACAPYAGLGGRRWRVSFP